MGLEERGNRGGGGVETHVRLVRGDEANVGGAPGTALPTGENPSERLPCSHHFQLGIRPRIQNIDITTTYADATIRQLWHGEQVRRREHGGLRGIRRPGPKRKNAAWMNGRRGGQTPHPGKRRRGNGTRPTTPWPG